jgi:hypothetical protein
LRFGYQRFSWFWLCRVSHPAGLCSSTAHCRGHFVPRARILADRMSADLSRQYVDAPKRWRYAV